MIIGKFTNCIGGYAALEGAEVNFIRDTGPFPDSWDFEFRLGGFLLFGGFIVFEPGIDPIPSSYALFVDFPGFDFIGNNTDSWTTPFRIVVDNPTKMKLTWGELRKQTVPYNPHGTIMDYMRRCYTVRQKVCSNDERTALKRWYFALDTAPVFPSWHNTGPCSWSLFEYVMGDPMPIGEMTYGEAFDYGTRPARGDGSRIDGAIQDFQGGVPAAQIGLVPTDADGIPLP